jgi:hypothetical protein
MVLGRLAIHSRYQNRGLGRALLRDAILRTMQVLWSGRGHRPGVQGPHQPVGIAPLRLTLDDERLTPDRELIAGPRVCDLAPPKLEGRGLGVDAGLAEATMVSGRPGGDAHRERFAAGRRIDSVDPERAERRVHRALEHRHQVRLPLISIRGRVQIGSGLDCTCSMTQQRDRRTMRAARNWSWSLAKAGKPA